MPKQISDTQDATTRPAIRRKSTVPKGVRTLWDMYAVGTDGQNYCYAVSESRADEIIRAVNSFDDMLAALKAAKAIKEDAALKSTSFKLEALIEIGKLLDAAIAKAGGQ